MPRSRGGVTPPARRSAQTSWTLVLAQVGTRHSGRRGAPRLVLLALAGLLLLGAVPSIVTQDETIVLARPGGNEAIEIVFDHYGTGHVFASTTGDAMYGLGYLQARHKLWLMHAVRLAATGSLGDLLGPAGTPTDRATMLSQQYTPEERAVRYARLPRDVREELEAFSAGVNRYLDEALTNPQMVPQELVLLGQWPIRPWVPDDTFATFIYATNEGSSPQLANTALLQRLVAAYGEQEGVAKFEDLVRTHDPDQPTTVPRDYNYHAVKPVLNEKELAKHRFHLPDFRHPTQLTGPGPAAAETPEEGTESSLLEQLALLPPAESIERALTDARSLGAATLALDLKLGSNAQIVGPNLSATGNSLLTSGPQSSYGAPALWYEFGVHVPGVWEFTGLTAASLNVPFVARMPSHAWTITSGISNDYFDWYIERLNPDNPREYLHRGQWEPMACREHVHTVHGVPTETQEICRTRHGPVYSFDEENGVAYTQRRPFFGREEQLLLAFRGMTRANDVEEFGTSAMRIPGTWNVFYADDTGNIAYWYAGYHPDRRKNVDLRLAMDGTGGHEWRGVVAPRHVPHAINPPRGWMGSWNNAPAADWPMGHAKPARHHFERLERAFVNGSGTAAPFQDGGVNPDDGLWDPADLWRNLQHGAHAQFQWNFRSALPDPEDLTTEQARIARDLVAQWDGLRVDRDGDGQADDPAYAIAGRWIGIAQREAFADDLPPTDLGYARPDGEVWHLLSPDSTARMRFDWLNGESSRAFAARTFQMAVEALAADRGSDDPNTWHTGMSSTRYAHLTALHLALDAARPTDCGTLPTCLIDLFRDDLGAPLLTEGYVAPHVAMNRGIFNGTVAYLDPPGARGASRVQACSVITPGIDGHIGLDGREGPHFQDQVPLYTGWQMHDWPVTRNEVEASRSNEFCEPISTAP